MTQVRRTRDLLEAQSGPAILVHLEADCLYHDLNGNAYQLAELPGLAEQEGKPVVIVGQDPFTLHRPKVEEDDTLTSA